MTAEERTNVLVTARFLEGALRVDLLSTGLTLFAMAVLYFAMHRLDAIVAIVLGIIAKVYAVRIAFDARLLSDVAKERLTSADLDAAFPKKAGRSWSDRCRGARRLVFKCAALTLLQAAVLILAVFR
jgi:hypothetical protein